MNYTYHFTRGPIGPADFPKGPVRVSRYDRGVYDHRFQRETWGFVVYDRPIQREELEKFGLLEDPIVKLRYVCKG